ncbi:MAG TPA: addiction module protein [Mucilaginibacter sp.]|nr:addiction module protein [Mucilaginibacter sp.]
MIKLQEILDLSVAERILMIEKIWDSLEHDDIEISAGHKQELDRRLDRYKKGETNFVSWSEIKSELDSYKK